MKISSHVSGSIDNISPGNKLRGSSEFIEGVSSWKLFMAVLEIIWAFQMFKDSNVFSCWPVLGKVDTKATSQSQKHFQAIFIRISQWGKYK